MAISNQRDTSAVYVRNGSKADIRMTFRCSRVWVAATRPQLHHLPSLPLLHRAKINKRLQSVT